MKPFATIATALFSILALAHLLRLFFKWEVIVNGFILPQWVSIPAFVILGALAFMLRREARRQQPKRPQ
jgi:hypothetical protein